ncbi:hypothetical protein [Thermohalobacter berrensis]|uniref:DUF4829 domain-containing protein n=1 Tax=Thermohalobacter berrensis TaxID=99594 RepID=A0A419T6V7_9FIRM|nr:hypothetical protein [Thermohalobacter berrensis]RKD33149.1 hypothetical protein BET03_09525 [Thermohalobacter berrensis]
MKNAKKTSCIPVIICLCLTLIIITLTNNEVIASSEKDNSLIYSKVIEDLLNKRVLIINKALYTNNSQNILNKLKSIETNNILTEDLKFLEKNKDKKTDYPYIHKVKVNKLLNINKSSSKLKVKALTEWKISYLYKDTKEKYYMNIELEKKGKKYFISSIEHMINK